jgi:hypothetical protein
LIADISQRDVQTCMQVLTRIRKKAEATDLNGNGRRATRSQATRLPPQKTRSIRLRGATARQA